MTSRKVRTKKFLEEKFLNLFSTSIHNNTRSIGKISLAKNFKAYFIKPIRSNDKITRSTTVDISALDLDSALNDISGWGGLTEVYSHAADIVASLEEL